MNLSGNFANNKSATSNRDLYTDLLKNRIAGLGNQLAEKNAIINYLTIQLILKFQNKTIWTCSSNNNQNTKINKDKVNDIQRKKEYSSNSRDYSRVHAKNCQKRWIIENEKSWCTEFSWGIQHRHFNKNWQCTGIIYVGTNDLTNDVNLLSNIKIVSKTSRTSNIIFRKDKRNIEKTRVDRNSRLKNFCQQKKY